MALMDHIREAHAKMAAGTLTEDEAARQLAEASEGELTVTGARGVLNQRPEDTEAQYIREFRRREATIRKVFGNPA